MNYYLMKNDERQGPFTSDQITGMVHKGECFSSDLVWRAGMEEWKPISAIPEIAASYLPAEPIHMAGTGNLNETARKPVKNRIGKIVGGLFCVGGALTAILLISSGASDNAMNSFNKENSNFHKNNQTGMISDSTKMAETQVGFGIGSLFLAGYGLVQIVGGLTSRQLFKGSINKIKEPNE